MCTYHSKSHHCILLCYVITSTCTTYVRTYVHVYVRTYVLETGHTYAKVYVKVRTYVHVYVRTYMSKGLARLHSGATGKHLSAVGTQASKRTRWQRSKKRRRRKWRTSRAASLSGDRGRCIDSMGAVHAATTRVRPVSVVLLRTVCVFRCHLYVRTRTALPLSTRMVRTCSCERT
jgi:hypothetical protein